MKTIRVTAVDYKTNKSVTPELPIVQLAGRDEYGERTTLQVKGTVPYFYARRDEARDIESHDDVWYIHDEYESYNGIPLSRIDVRVPANAGSRGQADDLTKEVDEPWESDIPFYRRVSIDYGLSGYIKVPEGKDTVHIDAIKTDVDTSQFSTINPRILIADIEVLPVDGTSFNEMTEYYNCPVTHISAWDSYDDEYICLYLDPEGEVTPSIVKDDLIEQSTTERVAAEVEKDITLRRYQNEEQLLDGFLSLVESRTPDIVSGWNFDDFDWDYLLNRYEKFDNLNEHRLSDNGWIKGYQIARKVDCLPAFDMLSAYKKMTVPFEGEKRSYSLDYVAKEELRIGKIPNIGIERTYHDDRSLMTAYNLMDVMLCVAIEREQSMHEFYLELAELSQVQIYDTFSEMRLIDGYIMSRSDKDEVLPTADDADIPENAGGLVLTPSSGLNDWVGVVDLKSLYPSCMITWNLSPETIHWYDDKEPSHDDYMNVPWLPDADHARGGDFELSDIDFEKMWVDLSTEGLIPKYIKPLFPERSHKKKLRDQYEPGDPQYDVYDRQQSAIKVVMNAFYGVTSMNYWRLSKFGLGDAITSTARYALWEGKEGAKDLGYEVLYGDTDSIMVSIAESEESKVKAIGRGEELERNINDRMVRCVDKSGLNGEHPYISDSLHGTQRHALTYEFEKLYRRFFQAGTKKRYAGNVVWKEGKHIDGDIDIVGFESQRSDSPEITEEVQPQIINRILEGQSFDEVSEYVQSLIRSIETDETELYRIALPITLKQPLREYGNTQAARACRYSNDNLDTTWSVGDDPWLYFIDKTPPMNPGTDVLALGWGEDLPEGYKLDMDKILERSLESPLKPILDEIGWNFTELKMGAQTKSGSETSGDWGSYKEEESDDAWGW